MLFLFILISSSVYTFASNPESSPVPNIAKIEYLHESSSTALSFKQAQEQFLKEQSHSVNNSQLTFGIKNDATWVRLTLQNESPYAQTQRLTASQTWIESLDVYMLTNAHMLKHWHTGDAKKADTHLLPDIGYVFDLNIPSGRSYVFIRAFTHDPLTMPINLQSYEQARIQDTKSHVISGIIYGILIVLVGYNIILYISLKQSDFLYYTLYIMCFIIINLGYCGYSFAWFYPNYPQIQNYFTLLFMVLHGVFGLLFVTKFLQLTYTNHRLAKFVYCYIGAGIISILACIIERMHLLTSLVAFTFLSITTVLMIIIGVLNLDKGANARYFVLAVLCSMTGLLVTILSVWGVIPYTYLGFNAASYGVVLEAIILAIILANRLTKIESDRNKAQYQASHDPLTGLLNRRSFMQKGNMLIDQHTTKPISFVIMDVDHFKSINDNYGHHIGDLALKHLAKLLSLHTREEELIARWGGEEFVMLMFNTSLSDAFEITQRVRLSIENTPLKVDKFLITMTASFGIAQRNEDETLLQLSEFADRQLYIAKNKGRNRVEG